MRSERELVTIPQGRPAGGPTWDGGPATPATGRDSEIVEIADMVRRVAIDDPSRVALIHAMRRPFGQVRYKRFTYSELSNRAERLAVGLRGIGVHEGTLCSFMVPPGFDAMVLGIALWRIGAVVVGIEPHSHGLANVGRSLAKVGPEVFVGTPSAHLARIAYGWGRGTVRTSIVTGSVGLPGMASMGSLSRGPVPDEPVKGAIEPRDPAVIAFTTGSTGAPKPTVLQQRNLAAMMSKVLGHWGLAGPTRAGRDEIIDMPTFPMFWIIGLAAGGTVVVPPMDFTLKGPGDADPALLLRTIRDCGVTSMFASPALLWNLARHAESHGIHDVGLKRIVAGGAEVPGPLFSSVRDVLGPGGEMYSDYGATEALPVTEIAGATVVEETWRMTERGAGVCVGKPLPGVEVRIIEIDDDTIGAWSAATELEVGQVGEVVARSPHISPEYYRQPRSDAENKIPDPEGSWHRLGDTGYLDAHGRLWVCGRRSQRVVTARGVTFPLQCEPVFNAHPAVQRSALVGVSDGQAATGAVICVQLCDHRARSDELAAELVALAQRHDSTRLVDRVHFVERVPVDRRHNAKIDRPRIAADLSPDPVIP